MKFLGFFFGAAKFSALHGAEGWIPPRWLRALFREQGGHRSLSFRCALLRKSLKVFPMLFFFFLPYKPQNSKREGTEALFPGCVRNSLVSLQPALTCY